MVMTRSQNGSRNPSRGGSPVLRGASPVRHGGNDGRYPSPFPRFSRGRMQTPSAAPKSAAKSDSPPRGRTMTRSASRAASRGGSPQAAVYARSDDNVKIAAPPAAAHYQPHHAKYPDRVSTVRAPSVSH